MRKYQPRLQLSERFKNKNGRHPSSNSVEQSIIEGELEVKELFEYAQNNAAQFEAYEMERAIFARLMRIGLAAMKCYFAEKGKEGYKVTLIPKVMLPFTIDSRRSSGLVTPNLLSVFLYRKKAAS